MKAMLWTKMCSRWEWEEGILVDTVKTFKWAPVAPRSSDLQQENKVCRGDSACPEWNVLLYV